MWSDPVNTCSTASHTLQRSYTAATDAGRHRGKNGKGKGRCKGSKNGGKGNVGGGKVGGGSGKGEIMDIMETESTRFTAKSTERKVVKGPRRVRGTIKTASQSTVRASIVKYAKVT